MSAFAEQLRAIRVFNNWDLITKFGRKTDVVIDYHAVAAGRMGYADHSRTTVWSPRLDVPHLERDTSRLGDRGSRKEFVGKRRHSFHAALAWAQTTFHAEYVPSPFGGYIPKRVRDEAGAAVKRASLSRRA